MRHCYRHLQAKDRIVIYKLLFKGYSILEIAEAVGCHKITIYRFIYSSEGLILKLYKHLFRKRRYRYPRIQRRRKTILGARKRSIYDRAASTNRRSRYGHWEGDLMLFRGTKTNLLTLRERKRRFIVALKNPSRKADETATTLIHNRPKCGFNTIKTLTLDNGVEFAQHHRISQKLKAKIYFCDPYKAYQKGAIENANKLLRTQLPRSTNIDHIKQEEIDSIVKRFNQRPMKCLGFQTPSEVFDNAFTD